METILIHPTYFTSITQMVAYVQAEKVFFEADDNYQKQSYRSRAYIAHSNGKLLLNIPIKHSQKGLRKKTNEVLVENSFPWQIQHWKSLESAYRTSPYFEYYEDELKPLFFKPVYSLFDFNLYLLLISNNSQIKSKASKLKSNKERTGLKNKGFNSSS